MSFKKGSFKSMDLLSAASVLYPVCVRAARSAGCYGVLLHLTHSLLSLTGLLNGNIYHVQRPHREERLPHWLGHHEHDAEQVSAACVQHQASVFSGLTLLLLCEFRLQDREAKAFDGNNAGSPRSYDYNFCLAQALCKCKCEPLLKWNRI